MGRSLCYDCKVGNTQGLVEQRQSHPMAAITLLIPILGYVLCAPVLIPFTSVAGLIMGNRVLQEVRERPHYSGRSAALMGMVLSGGMLGIWLVALLAMLVMYGTSR